MSLPSFLVAVVLISASPGPAMALIIRRAALRGFRASVPTVLGLEAGLYVWAILAARRRRCSCSRSIHSSSLTRPLLATTAGLAAVQVVVETGLYLALAVSVGRAGAWFQRPRIRHRFEALSGTVLVALGLRVAASSR